MDSALDLAREAIALAENWAQNSSKVQVLLIENGLEMSRALLSRDAEVARLREALVRAREDLEATFGWSQHDIRALRAAQGRIDAALEHKP